MGPTKTNPFNEDYVRSARAHGSLTRESGVGLRKYGSTLDPRHGKKSFVPNNDEDEDELNCNYLFKWVNLPQDFCLIFDETHRCKNSRTVNHAILQAAAESSARIMMLSATVCDKPENFALCGYVLGLYPRKRDARNWIEKANRLVSTDVIEGMPENSTASLGNYIDLGEKNRYANPMAGVHAKIFPEYAVRMRIEDLGDAFPENQVLAQCYDMATANEIEEQYKLIEEEVARLKKAEMRSQCALAQILYARMRIEQLKIPSFLELAKKYRDEGNAVAIFVNFTMTLKKLADELGTKCLIYGEQSMDERDKAIKDFEEDKEHIIICNIRSGGVGISLHDINGNYPRVTIISPSWSAQDVLQTLGRAHRANGKTKVRQRIVFCKGTIEEKICQSMKIKIENIAALNDGKMDSYKIEGLTDDLSDLGLDNMNELSEYEILCQKIETLALRKNRLKDDLKQVDEELGTLRLQLGEVVRKKHEVRNGSATVSSKATSASTVTDIATTSGRESYRDHQDYERRNTERRDYRNYRDYERRDHRNTERRNYERRDYSNTRDNREYERRDYSNTETRDYRDYSNNRDTERRDTRETDRSGRR
jgi:hypothetical protein